jgi:hypothetical protein
LPERRYYLVADTDAWLNSATYKETVRLSERHQMKAPVIIKHLYTKTETEYSEWDGVTSWDGRIFMACPVCGVGLCAPLDKPMAHKWCIEKYAERKDIK